MIVRIFRATVRSGSTDDFEEVVRTHRAGASSAPRAWSRGSPGGRSARPASSSS